MNPSSPDIVERLRRENDIKLSLGNDFSDLLLDAANEIEALRHDLERITDAVLSTLKKSAPGISATMRDAIVYSIILKLGTSNSSHHRAQGE